MKNVAQKSEKSIAGAIKIHEKGIVDNLSPLVRQSVAETINRLLDTAMLKRLGKKQNPLWKNCGRRSWMGLQNL